MDKMTKPLLYIDLIKENQADFGQKLIDISNRLNINPNWLMGVFYIETAASVRKVIDHRARNPKTNATGLIQFMPSTAESLGTTLDELCNMTNVEQLDYVEKYFKPYAKKINRFIDCYLAVFFPLAIGKPENWVIQAKNLPPEKVAAYNPLYDLNKDGKITVGEIETKLKSILPGYDKM